MKPISFPLVGAMCFRPANDNDTRCIVGQWLNSSVGSLSKTPARERASLKERLFPRVIGTVKRCDIVVLTSPTHPTVIHGWAAGKKGVLQYVYVPRELRGNGLARALITELLGSYPERITTSRPWPYASPRFVLESKEKSAA